MAPGHSSFSDRARRLRLLTLAALLAGIAAAVIALIGVPWPFTLSVVVVGLALAGAVWHGLGALERTLPGVSAIDIGAPRAAFSGLDPASTVERESSEIERLREIEHQLRLAKQEAEAATLAKGEFLATMSHEIRTPLNGIVPLIDVVLSSTLNSDQRQCLETAYASAQQLVSIVDDILDYSKIEANRLELESVSINLKELVDSVTQLMAHPAQAKGVSLSVRFDPQLRPLQRGDPVRLRQLLTNLVSNAVKFTERGSVVVQISQRGETATHTQVLFAIVDTGIGISTAAQSRLFQPFTQADNSVTRVFGGTGLGLAICARLVDVMRGEIGVKSVPGKGSTFWFSVPLLKASGDIVVPAKGVEGTRALVVCSDQQLISELATFFAAAHIQHTQTTLSADAVSRLRGGNLKVPRGMQSGSYQFVFLDWSGMRLTAQSMARGLLRDPAMAHLRIVLLTQADDEIPEDLADHRQVLIHPRVFDASRLRAALDADEVEPSPLRDVEELLGATGVPAHDVEVTAAMQRSTLPGPDNLPAFGSFDPGIGADQREAARPPAPASTHVPQAAPAPGATTRRVLLVEDNPVNRQVAQRLLSMNGLTVDSAEDGAAAFAMRFATPPLMMLMDCQMPVMDGYASTRAIRERESREGLPRMPIVAMTANAMLGDREKCLQAGMDDYLSKPLDRKALAQMLDRWLAVSEGRTTVVATRREVVSLDAATGVSATAPGVAAPLPTRIPPPAAAAPLRSTPAATPQVRSTAPVPARDATASSALDTAIIDDLIDMMGDDFDDLVRMYLHDAPMHIAQVRTAADGGDIAALVAPSHILKSSSANLGATILSGIAREIETSARQNRLPRPAPDMATDLERAYGEASIELTRLLSLRHA